MVALLTMTDEMMLWVMGKMSFCPTGLGTANGPALSSCCIEPEQYLAQ